LTREGDLDRDRDRNRRAVQGCGLEPPLLHRPDRLFVGFGIERARDAHVADGAVAEDDGRQFDDARHVPFQQARRIERLDLSNERRCRLLLSQDLLRTDAERGGEHEKRDEKCVSHARLPGGSEDPPYIFLGRPIFISTTPWRGTVAVYSLPLPPEPAWPVCRHWKRSADPSARP